MKRDSMIECNDKIVLENKLNVCECRKFECRESKSENNILQFLIFLVPQKF
jgi:hypothetical protein